MRPVVTDGIVWFVCWLVCEFVTVMSPVNIIIIVYYETKAANIYTQLHVQEQ